MRKDGWQFWIDRGGTFTDVVARLPDGTLRACKLLSESPGRAQDAAIEGIRRMLGVPDGAPLPHEAIDAVRMGTTVATNALLERTGEPTLLCITAGFGDALRIGTQARPRLFDRHIVLPPPVYVAVVEIDERVLADGTVLRAPDRQDAQAALAARRAEGYRAIAIVFMHAYRYPAHERIVAELARSAGFDQVSASHEVGPLIRICPRGDTTAVDAYLSPILRRYVDSVSASLGRSRLLFMQSSGGLADAKVYRGKDAILSGPAGGVVGAVATGRSAGFEKIIGFDMGGTSTDVSHFAGELERASETVVAGVRLRAPMMRIHTVAAGGGSILHFDGGRFRVGPDSAGANPGPACYRRGGPLTLTDCNVLLGRLPPEGLPAVFGPRGDLPLDAGAVRERFVGLAAEITAATGRTCTTEGAAEGFLTVGIENMASAIKTISVQRGYDVADYVLACFGGAGGLLACRVAEALGLGTELHHPLAGVLSAYGLGLAETRVLRQQSLELALPEAAAAAAPILADLARQAEAAMVAQEIAHRDVALVSMSHVRYAGTDAPIEIEHGTPRQIADRFEAAHRRRYGFVLAGRGLIIETVSVEAVARAACPPEPDLPVPPDPGVPSAAARRRLFAGGRWIEAPVYERAAMRPGHVVEGPAVVLEPHSTDVIEPGWRGEVTGRNHLVLRRMAPPRRARVGTAPDPVLLEVFNNLFMAIAEQMGATLANCASSVNIKERLDFSCAVFDAQGNLVANAPHMPVHLGSMGESVRAILRLRGAGMQPGDVFMLNAPYNGGTHLPDVTVITPVFDEAGGGILFFSASRGHHADIGGVTPGSMPPLSSSIEEEGVLLDNVRIVSGGVLLEAEVRRLLAAGPHPARRPDLNLADLGAQIAANARGAAELRRMVEHYSLPVVHAYMRHVQDNAAEHVRRILPRLTGGRFRYEMDDGAAVEVAVTIDPGRRSARVDFTGTSPQQASNFNAPAAVCRAAVLYVFRTLVDEDIPMNEGCLRPIEIVIPPGSLLDPRYPAAVVAGNVETSQVVTDALYGALGVLAAAQGTMNNFTFGDDRRQYYETICGGSGAGPDHDGTSAVHTHMTNSRLTDAEVLELRYPVMVESFAIRAGSGGRGRHRGGDGTVRRIRFLETMEASILSTHRRVRPFGLAGGEPGLPGRNRVERADGRVEDLPGTAQTIMRPGDVFVIETPGGGGYGCG